MQRIKRVEAKSRSYLTTAIKQTIFIHPKHWVFLKYKTSLELVTNQPRTTDERSAARETPETAPWRRTAFLSNGSCRSESKFLSQISNTGFKSQLKSCPDAEIGSQTYTMEVKILLSEWAHLSRVTEYTGKSGE